MKKQKDKEIKRGEELGGGEIERWRKKQKLKTKGEKANNAQRKMGEERGG